MTSPPEAQLARGGGEPGLVVGEALDGVEEEVALLRQGLEVGDALGVEVGLGGWRSWRSSRRAGGRRWSAVVGVRDATDGRRQAPSRYPRAVRVLIAPDSFGSHPRPRPGGHGDGCGLVARRPPRRRRAAAALRRRAGLPRRPRPRARRHHRDDDGERPARARGPRGRAPRGARRPAHRVRRGVPGHRAAPARRRRARPRPHEHLGGRRPPRDGARRGSHHGRRRRPAGAPPTTPAPGCSPPSGPARPRPWPAAGWPWPRRPTTPSPAWPTSPGRFAGVDLVLATDEETPLLGLQGTSAVESPAQGRVGRARRRPSRTPWATSPTSCAAPCPTRPTTCSPGCRAGSTASRVPGPPGGLGYALLALGGRRVSAVETVLRESGFGPAAARADLVVTGAGRVDWTTLRGSVVAGVAAATLETARPTVLVAGECLVGRRETMTLGLGGHVRRRRHRRARSRRWSPTPSRRWPSARPGSRGPGRPPADRPHLRDPPVDGGTAAPPGPTYP